MGGTERDEGNNPLPLDLVGTTHHGRLGYRGMAHQRALHLGRAETMTGNVEHVVDTTDDPEIPLLVAAGAIPGEVGALHLAPVLLAIALHIAPNASEHGGPWLADDEFASLTMRNLLAVIIDNGGIDSEERERSGTRLARGGTWKRCDHVSTRLGLPPGVHDGATFATHVLVEPHPCLGIDRFPNGSEQPERGEVVLLEVMIAPLHKSADGRGCGVKDGDAVIRDELPESIRLGPVGSTLVHEAGRSVGKGSVDKVAMAGDPSDVGRAPVDIILLEIEDILGRGIGADHITAGGMQDTLRFSR